MTPLISVSDQRLSVPGLYALDTETTRFDEPVYGWKGKTRVLPFGGHTLVLGSLAGAGVVEVYHRAALCKKIGIILANGSHLVFHHCAFDIPVLCAADPSLLPLFSAAVEQCRIHDTKLLEVLIQIAIGSRAMGSKQLVSSPSLASLAKSRAGMTLDKTSGVRVSFGDYLDPRTPIPRHYLEYALDDARATYLVYMSQLREALVVQHPSSCKYPVFKDAPERFGPLSENIQVKGALAFAWLEQFPLRVDLDRAKSIRSRVEGECLRLEAALIQYGWASRGPKSGKFALKFKKLRAVLLDYAKESNIVPEYSPTGLVNLGYDFWANHIPKLSKDLYNFPERATTVDEKLQVWLRYGRGRKLLSTYIYIYASSPVHYPQYQNIGARTGRTSCAHPNAQNIPKRHDGIRALFVPSPGKVFIEADYNYAELVALAQVYHVMYGGSVLETLINSGEDPHIGTARRLVPEFDALSEMERKTYRQAAKAVNFGLPGGLGVRTFQKYAAKSFGFERTEEEIKVLRQQALATDPQLTSYLSDQLSLDGRLSLVAHNLNLSLPTLVTLLDAWAKFKPDQYDPRTVMARLTEWVADPSSHPIPCPIGVDPKWDLFRQTTRTLTGRVRDRASYTEAHNTPFQGLVADGSKLALWNLYRTWLEFPCFSPVAYIHDSILVECSPESYDRVCNILRQTMIAGLRSVCPDILCGVELTAPLPRWGKDLTNPWGEPICESTLPVISAPAPLPLS